MAPKSPWNARSVPTNVSKQPPAQHADEVQAEEIEVLQAIYMENFRDLEVKTAWNKTAERRFTLVLQASNKAEVFVTMFVTLSATYPKSPPTLAIDDLGAFHERTKTRISNVIAKRPLQLVGDVMIYVIASEIQEALDDAVQARVEGTLPSLDEERASAEEVANALAKQAVDDETRRALEAQEDEDRVLRQMVDEELHRRQKRQAARSTIIDDDHAVDTTEETIRFDQPASITVESETLHFSSVTIVWQQNDDQWLGKPLLSAKNSRVPLVAINRFSLPRKSREELGNLERILVLARAVKGDNIACLYAFRIDKFDVYAELTLCAQQINGGTLRDSLMLHGTLDLEVARRFTLHLLEAIDTCHRTGVAHGSISTATIIVSTTAPPTPILMNTAYGSSLSDGNAHAPRSLAWHPPEGFHSVTDLKSRKTDIWMLGIVVLQMFLGPGIIENSTPSSIWSKASLGSVFMDFARRLLTHDFRKRPSPFDLLPAEFLRTSATAIEQHEPVDGTTYPSSVAGAKSPARRHSRHNSSNVLEPVSRYAADFTELGRLGKGGFGEVVKARNKLDGSVYAIKKISQAPQLDHILSEVMLLNRLNHPYVVRYYSTWVEENVHTKHEEATSTTDETVTEDRNTDTGEDAPSHSPRYDFGYQSASGLDFVSSSGYPQIEFGDDSGSESDDSASQPALPADAPQEVDDIFEARESSPSPELAQPRTPGTSTRKILSTLYIQMEYCERRTLRDYILRVISEEDAWRFIRQITEGLAHVHGHGIIHRDLKPDNIFIDALGNPKIGDFGLATTSQYLALDSTTSVNGSVNGDMTRSVGTALYVAPELRSGSGGSYTDKVDMYSLGIMFYEMCEPFATAMERIRALQLIREKGASLPAQYQASAPKAAQGRLIECLISHKPSERPSSTELLRSNVLPLKIEDETIRQALDSLGDARSPYHQKMMSALFSHDEASNNRVKALAWDAKHQNTIEKADYVRARAVAKGALETIFRRHGAEEVQRESVFPRSSYHDDPRVVQLLDASGNLVQLPYDLTLPFARQLAHADFPLHRAFTFGRVYRDAFTGGPPRVSEEVDFDIVSTARDGEQALEDAEVLKVLDEITSQLPTIATNGTVSLQINHANLLDAIMEHCKVPTAQYLPVKQCISKLGYQAFTWEKIRSELRSPPLGLSMAVVEDLQQFDIRVLPEKASGKLLELTSESSSRVTDEISSGLKQLEAVIQYARHMSIKTTIYLAPLASYNAKYYDNGILVQLVHDRKSGRDVIAAGGRYDSLIRAHCTAVSHRSPQGAVGISIGLDRLVANIAKNSKSGNSAAFVKSRARAQPLAKRCTALLVASGSEAVRIAALKILSTVWASDISAELPDDSIQNLDEDQYTYVITLRHEASTTVRFRSTSDDAEELDVPTHSLVSHIQQDLRDREGAKSRIIPSLPRQVSHQDPERKTGNVHVLLAQHRSKKSNKYHIVNAAEQRWAEKLDSWKEAPILAVETRDDVLDLIRDTRLSDAESWRKAVQAVTLNERQYLQQVQEILASWRKKWSEDEDGASREACVFNFRSGACVYYDLGS
ncbi:eukaryotic translation initiation factor 2-alpha kinase [Oleoguttula sp. CCFEE 5521]